MNYVRLRLRTVLVLIGIIAFALGASIEAKPLLQTSRQHHFWATMHGKRADSLSDELAETESAIDRCNDPTVAEARWKRSGLGADCKELFVRDDRQLVQVASKQKKQLEHHSRMSKRYEKASWLPWLEVRIEPEPE